MEATALKGMITTAHLNDFRKIVGNQFVLIDEESLNNYGHDETEELLYPPEAVLRPRTAE